MHRLIIEAQCGLYVPPDDPAAAQALCYAASHSDELAEMGARGRRYLEEQFSRRRSVDQIEAILTEAAGN